jgi:hypothetical protein
MGLPVEVADGSSLPQKRQVKVCVLLKIRFIHGLKDEAISPIKEDKALANHQRMEKSWLR